MDDAPCRSIEFANIVAQCLHLPPVKAFPRWAGKLIVGGVVLETMTKNLRAKNTKLKNELGWRPQYANCHMGIPAVIEEIEKG